MSMQDDKARLRAWVLERRPALHAALPEAGQKACRHFLTRIGFGSKAVVTGDITQVDLPKAQSSGLVEARRILAGVRGLAFTEFDSSDVVRHPLVARIVDAYERDARQSG